MPSLKEKTKNNAKGTQMKESQTKTQAAGLELKQHLAPTLSSTEERGLLVTVYNMEGKEVEKIKLPEEIFGLKVNPDLVKQAVEAQMSQARIPYAHTKDRGEVRGGGRKPWRQKGTGRARHGSIRSPLWRGGGVTFGPRKEKVFAKNINKKMRRKALLMVLSGKARDKEIIILDDLKLAQPKTKLMAEVLDNIFGVLKLFRSQSQQSQSKESNQSFMAGGAPSGLIVLPKKDENVIRATRNIPKFSTIGAQSLNVVDLLRYKYLLMPKGAVEIIEKTFLKQS